MTEKLITTLYYVWQCNSHFVLSIATTITSVLTVLLCVAYMTLAERKVLASVQLRRGPDLIGFIGLLQPIADGVKLIAKEAVIPRAASATLFIIASVGTFFFSLLVWSLLPLSNGNVLVDSSVGLLYILAISSLGSYGIIIAGWSSNSRYAFLGACRSTAQMISYELSIGLILISLIIITGTMNLSQIVTWQQHIYLIFPLLPVFIMFFISALAETSRPPFDLPEAEGELVAGYNVEYTALNFALFFLAEYASIIAMSFMSVILFVGGWLFLISIISILSTKASSILYFFILVRSAVPRYRYDTLMQIGFKSLFPCSLAFISITANLSYTLDWFWMSYKDKRKLRQDWTRWKRYFRRQKVRFRKRPFNALKSLLKGFYFKVEYSFVKFCWYTWACALFTIIGLTFFKCNDVYVYTKYYFKKFEEKHGLATNYKTKTRIFNAIVTLRGLISNNMLVIFNKFKIRMLLLIKSILEVVIDCIVVDIKYLLNVIGNFLDKYFDVITFILKALLVMFFLLILLFIFSFYNTLTIQLSENFLTIVAHILIFFDRLSAIYFFQISLVLLLIILGLLFINQVYDEYNKRKH
jgi:NADH-quinone oxidoreductase subunit H